MIRPKKLQRGGRFPLRDQYMGNSYGDMPIPATFKELSPEDIARTKEEARKKKALEDALRSHKNLSQRKEEAPYQEKQRLEKREQLNRDYAATHPEYKVDDKGDLQTSGYGEFMQKHGKTLDKTANMLWKMSEASDLVGAGAGLKFLGKKALEKIPYSLSINRGTINEAANALKRFRGKSNTAITLDPNEAELVKTVRSFGSARASGEPISLSMYERVINKAEYLSDKAFEKLTGKTKDEMRQIASQMKKGIDEKKLAEPTVEHIEPPRTAPTFSRTDEQVDLGVEDDLRRFQDRLRVREEARQQGNLSEDSQFAREMDNFLTRAQDTPSRRAITEEEIQRRASEMEDLRTELLSNLDDEQRAAFDADPAAGLREINRRATEVQESRRLDRMTARLQGRRTGNDLDIDRSPEAMERRARNLRNMGLTEDDAQRLERVESGSWMTPEDEAAERFARQARLRESRAEHMRIRRESLNSRGNYLQQQQGDDAMRRRFEEPEEPTEDWLERNFPEDDPEDLATHLGEPTGVAQRPSVRDALNYNKGEGDINYYHEGQRFRQLHKKPNLWSELTKEKGLLPHTPLDEYNEPESLIGSMFKEPGTNPAAKMIGAYKQVENSPKGSWYRPSKSLSSDSFPMSYSLMNKAVKNNLVDLQFHGYHDLNTLGFTGKVLPKDLVLKDINATISQLNTTIGEGLKVPLAKLDSYGNIQYPDLSIMRKLRGGKMQLGGSRQADFYNQQETEELRRQIAAMQQPRLVSEDQVMGPPEPAPLPTVGLNPVQEGVKKGIITLPSGVDYTGAMQGPKKPTQLNAAQQVNPNTPKSSLTNRMMEAGLGLKTFTTAAAMLSGYVARNRDNQYDYKQQTGLGMLNPMPAQPFQPVDYNPYAQQGGNPFSHYAKYGGNLKTIMKDFNQFSNDIAYKFGEEGSDSNDDGMMKKGGFKQDYEVDRMLVVRKVLPELLHFGRMMRKMRFQQGGQTFQTQEQLNAANQMARSLAMRHGLITGENTYAGRNIGDPVPPMVDAATGMPYVPTPTRPKATTIPPEIGIDSIQQYGNEYGYDHPQTGDWTPINNELLNLPRFQKPKQQVVLDQLKRPALPSMASMRKGGIHIKPENKGKFTSYCGGKVTDDCIQKGKNSPSAAIRKRATFAANARKWN